jgi:hypothetical protein
MKTLLIPAGIMAAFILLISALTPQPQATAEPLITEVVQQQTGPGYTPPADASDCKCVNCNCDELEKRVAELEAKVAAYGSARPVVSNGIAGQSGGVAVSRPVTTAGLPYGAVVVSERVVSTRPAPPLRQMQQAQPLRNVFRGVANGTCRIVNGIRVCN